MNSVSFLWSYPVAKFEISKGQEAKNMEFDHILLNLGQIWVKMWTLSPPILPDKMIFSWF